MAISEHIAHSLGDLGKRVVDALPYPGRDARRLREACGPFDEMPPEGYVAFDLTGDEIERDRKEFEELQILEGRGIAAALKASRG